jgi:cell division septation protein DedD
VKASLAILVASTAALLIPGCGTTEESSEEHQPAISPLGRPPDSVATTPSRRTVFETRTDTVNALRGLEHRINGSAYPSEGIRYMVQIGAFSDPHHATIVQAEARKRYHLPVLNDYHAVRKLYQIRIGFFESRESARRFRQQLIHDYPADYSDSWVVQLKR